MTERPARNEPVSEPAPVADGLGWSEPELAELARIDHHATDGGINLWAASSAQ